MPDDFLIARNPEADSTLPFLVRIPLGADGIVLKARETWPRTSKVWKELGDALRLGCTMSNGVATAPSFEDQLGGDRDAFETMIALPGARLLRRPNDGASVVANLKWNVLTMREAWNGGPWIAVRLDDGRSGFVRRALARSPIDYRAWFRKREGKWRMEGFLAGD